MAFFRSGMPALPHAFSSSVSYSNFPVHILRKWPFAGGGINVATPCPDVLWPFDDYLCATARNSVKIALAAPMAVRVLTVDSILGQLVTGWDWILLWLPMRPEIVAAWHRIVPCWVYLLLITL